MLSLSYPHTTKDSTKPYLAEQELVLFLKGRFNEGLYYRRKSKGYTTKVITATKKLLLDNLKDIKDNLSKAQN